MRIRHTALAASGIALAAVGAWLVSENRRLAVTAERLHDDLRAAAATEHALSDAVVRLEGELRAAFAARDAVVATIDQKATELATSRDAQRDRLLRATAPMPEGVRLALLTINDLLRSDGHGTIRFLRAARIDDRTLFDAELTEHQQDRLATSVVAAGRIAFELDRATGTLALRCHDGMAFEGGGERPLPAEGETILLPVDGPAWEANLPFLVHATGAYPPADDARPTVPAIDQATARIWAERLDVLLARADTEVAYQVGRLHDLEGTRFLRVLVHGYDGKKLLAVSISAQSLEVCVDDAGDTTELLLRDGVLLQKGVQSAIPASGYRVFLPGVSAKAARDAMLGLVVARGS